MSGINGDKARFHKDRKKKIAKRKRVRELLHPKSATLTAGGGAMTTAVGKLQ
jgi:hypothetical protein